MAQRAIKSPPPPPPPPPLPPLAGGKVFAFHDAIIAYHYLSRNPKFAMKTVN